MPESAVDRYHALSPETFPILRRLAVFETEGPRASEVAVELSFFREDAGDDDEHLVVRCAGVRELVFQQPFTTLMQVHVLEVEDHTGAQMEDVRYRVRDAEQSEYVAFWCRTFEAERVGGAGPGLV